ncbi:MAG: hypothetical protein R3C56_15020 [Pirellulaceae bacterium]
MTYCSLMRDKLGYPDYLTKLLPLVRPGGRIIGHIHASSYPSPEYIRAITIDPALEQIHSVV